MALALSFTGTKILRYVVLTVLQIVISFVFRGITVISNNHTRELAFASLWQYDCCAAALSLYLGHREVGRKEGNTKGYVAEHRERGRLLLFFPASYITEVWNSNIDVFPT